MVYFWTYAHPLYCPSDLQARGFNSVVGPMHCRSDGHVKDSILVHPTYFKLQSLDNVSYFSQVGWHFLQVGWAFFVGRMGIFHRSDGPFSQVGWAFFVQVGCRHAGRALEMLSHLNYNSRLNYIAHLNYCSFELLHVVLHVSS